jgi:uncharacterized Zn finger protein
MRKSYGTTYWGEQFLNALNEIDYSNRLPRGKTYANKGLVENIKISNNHISAEVQGSSYKPYKVKFNFPAFSEKQKAQILELVTDNPAYLSKLLNRELPSILDRACRRLGIHIFPSTWRDVQGNCSCPDSAVPCKHMAATLYIIANEIDKNPFLVFGLHDFDLFKGLEGIGYTTTGERDVYIPSLSNITEDFSFSENHFVWEEEVFNKLDFSNLPDYREQLMTLLSEHTVFFPEGDFKKILEKAYKSLNKTFLKKRKAEAPDETDAAAENAEEIEIILDKELEFLNCNLRDARGKSVSEYKDLNTLIEWLETIPLNRFDRISEALRGLVLTNALAQKLAINSALIPQLLRVGTKHYKVRWLPALMNEIVQNISEKVSQLTPPDLLFFKLNKDIKQSNPEEQFTSLLSLFLTHYMNESFNADAKVSNTEVGRMFFNGDLEHFGTFENREHPKAIQLWLNKFYISERDYVPVLHVEDTEEIFEVSVAVDDKTQPLDAPIPLLDIFEKNKYNHMRLEILRSLSMLSDYFPGINDILASKGTLKLEFDSEEFTSVLFKILPIIQLFGIQILLPKALRKLMRPKVSLSMDVSESGDVGGTSIINLDEMLSFQWKIAIGDNQVSFGDFLNMVKKYKGIVKINDAYVYFNEDEIQKLLSQLENPPDLDNNELLQIALTEDYDGARVELSKQLKGLMNNLLSGDAIPQPEGLKATLRPYQQRGFEWLYKNTRLGFGSIIADDMGLGKTLQVITTLLKLKEDGELEKRKALVIVPTTLLTNWGKEIAKFAPNLKPHIYHGSNRDIKPLKDADILITTYGVARSDDKLSKQKWLCTIIDEAQAIKNPGTAQTKAIKKIKSPVKIAMSGTPVENRLSEYWSIMDFTNKGYLDSLKNFKENYAKPIEVERDQEKLERFKQITEPFILRRLKSDKTIIKDLPDKIEKDQYCALTKEQAALYQNVVDTTMENINKSDGIARKGLILKLITALKQVCNHPAHFLKKGAVEPAFSGKAMLLMDLMTDILEQNQKTLIFTQYQEMGRHLQTMLAAQFGLEAEFLHGGVAREKRDAMVDDFQDNRATKVLILSLKAGGTGLNLTAASNVIHYDLWWNPAVEAQATDRAYRIGQKNNVMVHRFITQGTFEEKINELLMTKKELANLTVSTGEKWIGEYSDGELMELVKLG